jgi:hypothetical protein
MASVLRRAAGPSSSSRVATIIIRPYHATPTLRHPYKDSQDRRSLRPGSSENTKSGRDDEVASNPDAAFNPHKTRPESEAAAASEGNETNPLEATGANQELSKPRGDEKAKASGPGKETNKGSARSGFGAAPKRGDPKQG